MITRMAAWCIFSRMIRYCVIIEADSIYESNLVIKPGRLIHLSYRIGSCGLSCLFSNSKCGTKCQYVCFFPLSMLLFVESRQQYWTISLEWMKFCAGIAGFMYSQFVLTSRTNISLQRPGTGSALCVNMYGAYFIDFVIYVHDIFWKEIFYLRTSEATCPYRRLSSGLSQPERRFGGMWCPHLFASKNKFCDYLDVILSKLKMEKARFSETSVSKPTRCHNRCLVIRTIRFANAWKHIRGMAKILKNKFLVFIMGAARAQSV